MIQRIKCVVWQDAVEKGDHSQSLLGTGGVSHAEQRAWAKAEGDMSRGGTIKFEVDGPICSACTGWFETTMFQKAQALGATLVVAVSYMEFQGQITVTGLGTVWGQVSEAGYYEAQRLRAEARREQEMRQKRQEEEESARIQREKKASLPESKKKKNLNALGAALEKRNEDSFF